MKKKILAMAIVLAMFPAFSHAQSAQIETQEAYKDALRQVIALLMQQLTQLQKQLADQLNAQASQLTQIQNTQVAQGQQIQQIVAGQVAPTPTPVVTPIPTVIPNPTITPKPTPTPWPSDYKPTLVTTFLSANSTIGQTISVGYEGNVRGGLYGSKTQFNFFSPDTADGGIGIYKLQFAITGENTIRSLTILNDTEPVVNGIVTFGGFSIPNGGNGVTLDVFASYNPVSASTESSIALTYIGFSESSRYHNGASATYCNSGCDVQLLPISAPTMTLVPAN